MSLECQADLLLTIEPVSGEGPLCRYRCQVFQRSAAAVQDEPIFRCTTESAEMGRHALQTWLDRHGAMWRRTG